VCAVKPQAPRDAAHSRREVTFSFVNALWRCHSTVRALMNN
jgi:hypothetical protein